MKLRIFFYSIILVLLSACQSIVGDTGATETPAPPPESNTIIQWERDPSYIIFRADISPDPDPTNAFIMSGEVPFCTIYGDGTVVWTQEVSAGGGQVLFGPADDARIRRFVEWLTLYKEIYTYTAELDTDISTVTPIVETLFLNVNGIAHTTDALGGWQPGYFAEILAACKELSPQPQIYEPQGAWLSAIEAPFDNNANSVLWEPSVTGVDLRAITDSGEPQWVTGRGLQLLWLYLKRSTPDLQFGQLDGNFIVVLQIPNITRVSPTPETPSS